MHLRALLAASFLGLGFAFLHPMPQRRPTATRMSVSGPEPVDRRSWGLTAASALSLLLLPKKSLAEDVTLPSGLSYSVISSGSVSKSLNMRAQMLCCKRKWKFSK